MASRIPVRNFASRFAALAAILAAVSALGGEDPPRAPQTLRIAARGRWVLDPSRNVTPPPVIARGLETSGLALRGKELWSLGDQRSAYPGHLFRIDPRTGMLTSPPLRLAPAAAETEEEFRVYRSIRNPDFEGLCADPTDGNRFFAVTEDKVPWIAEIRVEDGDSPDSAPSASIERLYRLRFPEGLEPWKGDTNFRVEGISASDDGKTIYLAFERARDGLPRLFSIDAGELRGATPPRWVVLPVPFERIPPRADRPEALLNLNDIQFAGRDGRPCLVGVLRDQERLLVIDLDPPEIALVFDLELADSSGDPIEWVSPEGLAFDRAEDRLWLINDPDSIRANYRLRSSQVPEGRFRDYAPLLFELRLSEILGRRGE